MAVAGTYNTSLDPGVDYVFYASFADEGGGPIDLSGLTFAFTLTRNRDNSVVWDLNDSFFSRPATGQITFTKVAADVRALLTGDYSLSLTADGTAFIDSATRTFSNDEWLNGTMQR